MLLTTASHWASVWTNVKVFAATNFNIRVYNAKTQVEQGEE
jgi:hypothetical protein